MHTDHHALLQWLNRMTDNNARLTRSYLFLQPFDFTLKHRTGKANGNAGALSCGPLDVNVTTPNLSRDQVEM